MTDIPEGFHDVSELGDKGVLKKVLTEGCGEAKPSKGYLVSVHYVGTLSGGEKDGEIFDSSRKRDEQFKFTLGEGKVIKGWDIGVATMKKGEKCELICAPEYAYGDKASGPIPAKSTLKFEVELFGWKGKDISPNKDGSVIQSIITPGVGFESPKECVPVTIEIKGIYNDCVFDERTVEFEVGDCITHNIIPGIEIALKKMRRNEHSSFDISYEHAFGVMDKTDFTILGKPDFKIPGKSTVQYEIKLVKFEKFKETYNIENSKEKIEQCESFKKRATEKFQSKNYLYASKLYAKAAKYIEFETDFTEQEDKTSRTNLLLSLRLNLAQCFLNLKDYGSAITESDKALIIDEKNEKGLFRRGKGLMMRGDFEEAKKCFGAVLTVNGDNKQAKTQMKECDEKMKEIKERHKDLYKNMFAPKPASGASSSTL